MPIAYLEMVHLEFANGRVWQIDIRTQLGDEGAELVADKLLETLQEYKEEITKIDFKIDIARLKKDISKSTNSLF